MAGAGDSTHPFPGHRRGQLSQSHGAGRHICQPLPIGDDRPGVAHHGHHLRSRTPEMRAHRHSNAPSLSDTGGRSPRWSRYAILIAGCSSLTACMVGPNYRAPPAVDTGSGWSRPVGEASAQTDLDRWWRALGDPELERLVDTAPAKNLAIRQATARTDESRALRDRVVGRHLPTGSSGARVTPTCTHVDVPLAIRTQKGTATM